MNMDKFGMEHFLVDNTLYLQIVNAIVDVIMFFVTAIVLVMYGTASAFPTSDIQFILNDTYNVGDTVEFKIKNVGILPYEYEAPYEACRVQYFDETGRKFIIPPGTHCDIVMSQYILPGQTKKVFTWKLDECIEDNWGCGKSAPLKPGKYTLKREYVSLGYLLPIKIAKAEKMITIVSG